MEWNKETINAALTFDLCLALADDSQSFVVRSYILQVVHQRLEELEQKAVTGNTCKHGNPAISAKLDVCPDCGAEFQVNLREITSGKFTFILELEYCHKCGFIKNITATKQSKGKL